MSHELRLIRKRYHNCSCLKLSHYFAKKYEKYETLSKFKSLWYSRLQNRYFIFRAYIYSQSLLATLYALKQNHTLTLMAKVLARALQLKIGESFDFKFYTNESPKGYFWVASKLLE